VFLKSFLDLGYILLLDFDINRSSSQIASPHKIKYLFPGLGAENEVLDSAEFYDLETDKWTQTSGK